MTAATPQSRDTVPPGYKQTEVGVIPEDWEVRTLGDVLSKGRLGGNYPNQEGETEYPLIKMGNLARGGIDLNKVEYISQGVTPDPQHRLNMGDVLFNTRNTLDLVGKVAIWRDELPVAYYNSNIMRLEFDASQVCSNEYANATLNTRQSIADLHGLATGTTSVAAIYTRDLLGLPFVVPTRAEQEAIAGALSDADGWIESLEKLIEKKRAIKQGTMQALLTPPGQPGHQRLPGFEGEWEVKRLGSAATLKARIGWQGLKTSEYLETGAFRLVSGTEFREGHIDWTACYCVSEARYKQDRNIQLQEQDVLVTKDGTIGKVTIVRHLPQPATLNSGVFVVRPVGESFISEFFYYLMLSRVFVDFLNQLSAGSTINHLYQKDFVGFIFQLPPALSEQSAIANVLADIDAEIEALEAKQAKARQIKQGMMQELLTGKVRLV